MTLNDASRADLTRNQALVFEVELLEIELPSNSGG